MNIEGLDYNTQRKQLILQEYGREVQKMIDHAVGIADRQERQACAESIINIMARMFPHNRENADYMQKLWDHLAIMSEFRLDIDYPYDVTEARQLSERPEVVPYPQSENPVRHYGRMVFMMLERLKALPEGKERDELARLTANQMKRNLAQWGHGSASEERVISDLSRFTDGVIQLDPTTFKFDNGRGKTANDKRRKRR